jgi:hypothetical protein
VIAHRAWSEAHEDVEPVSPGELLATFEQLRAAGEIDDQEFQRVRDRLGGQREPAAPQSEGDS